MQESNLTLRGEKFACVRKQFQSGVLRTAPFGRLVGEFIVVALLVILLPQA